MPSFPGITFHILARHGRIKLNHRFAAFDRRIRTSGNVYARLNETVPSVRAFETFDPQPGGCEMQIADRMRSLHGRNDTQLFETRDIDRVYDLRMLDAPTRL